MPYADPARQKKYMRDRGLRIREERRRAKLGRPSKYALHHGDGKLPVWKWIEQYCVVPTGPLRGRPFKLPGWQRAFLRGPLAHPTWRGVVASLTGKLAHELRDAVVATAARAASWCHSRRPPRWTPRPHCGHGAAR